MKTKLLAIGIILGLLLLLAAACTSTGEAADNVPRNTHKTLEVTYEEFLQNAHISRTVELINGDTLTLVVVSNPSTGFSWTEQAKISKQDVIKQTGHEYKEPSDTGSPAAGTSGKEVWTFETLKKGTSEISLEYSRPWEGGEKAEWSLNLIIIVK